MPINMINPLTSTQSAQQSSEVSQMTDPDMFLKLLMAGIQNQDPFNSDSDPTAQMTQLVQFANLEAMNKLNSNIEALFQVNATTQAMSLIGNEATISYVDEQTEEVVNVTGMVSSVKFDGGESYVVIDGTTYPTSSIKEIAASGE